MKKIGLIVNPIAGMGGKVGLKGTDGEDVLRIARNLGAVAESENKAKKALLKLAEIKEEVVIYTSPGQMGERVSRACGFETIVLEGEMKALSTYQDTRKAAVQLVEEKVDLLLFAGGDGTARDIYESVGLALPSLGIPTGVKMHSAVYAINPEKAGELAIHFLKGARKKTGEHEVMDIDEAWIREDRVVAKLYGYLTVPEDRVRIQGMKSASPTTAKYQQDAIACDVLENILEDQYYLIGPGTTTKAIMDRLGLDSTLLGVDLIKGRTLIGKDLSESEIMAAIAGKNVKLIITPTGGQGYLLGRGNQQLSASVITEIGKENIMIVATKDKLLSFGPKGINVDLNDEALNKSLSGYHRVICGYDDRMMVKVSG